MEAIFNSFLLVLATEMGDKTQLLALVLASRFKKPLTIMSGIFVATVLNHLIASSVGAWVTTVLPERYLYWILALMFIAFALWILIPDSDDVGPTKDRFGAFITTIIAFFLAEMGDKTQACTMVLAARYQSVYLVTIGSTAGMMVADGLAVFFGQRITNIIPMVWVRRCASVLFILFGVSMIIEY